MLILSWALNPHYCLERFNINLPKINWVDLSQYIQYYYIAWTGKKPTTILCELQNYSQKKFPFNDSYVNQFQANIFAYW